jgi:hypothetical protein
MAQPGAAVDMDECIVSAAWPASSSNVRSLTGRVPNLKEW